MVVSVDNSTNKWILDIGASFHMASCVFGLVFVYEILYQLNFIKIDFD